MEKDLSSHTSLVVSYNTIVPAHPVRGAFLQLHRLIESYKELTLCN
nr:hypothetical protein BN993_06517 [Virgibacillus halodenitrificans]